MTFTNYFRLIVSRWRWLVGGFILSLIIAGLLLAASPTRYSASLVMYVSAQAQDQSRGAYEAGLLSQQRIISYIELVEGRRISEEIASSDSVGGTDPLEVQSMISATSENESVLLNIDVAGSDPDLVTAVANGVVRVFPPLVASLEAPAPGAPPVVNVRVVDAPEAATPQVKQWLLVLSLAAFSGLLLGVVGAITRNSFDKSIGSRERLAEISDISVIGQISESNSNESKLLSSRSNIEEFREVRTNLQFSNVDNPPKVIAVTSSVEGEGKTFISYNLSIAFADAGSSVLLIDGDMRRPQVKDVAKIDATTGLSSVLSSQSDLQSAIVPGNRRGLSILASGPLPPNPTEMLSSNAMRALVATARSRFQIVIVDTPPVLPVADAAALSQAVDGIVIVVRAKSTNSKQVVEAHQALEKTKSNVLGTILSRARIGREAYSSYTKQSTHSQPQTGPVRTTFKDNKFKPSPVRRPTQHSNN